MNLEHLTSEFPSDPAAVRRVLSFFDSKIKAIKQDPRASDFTKSYSVDQMFAIAETSSYEFLSKLLLRLEQKGVIKNIVRVEANSMGIQDFPSIEEVPDEIYDWHQDRTIPVSIENLHLYVQLQAENSN